MNHPALTDPSLIKIIKDASSSTQPSRAGIDELLEIFERQQTDEELAAQVRLAFLLLLEAEPALLDKSAVAHFLASNVESSDLDKLRWQTPTHILEFCETLYGFRFNSDELTKKIRMHVRYLLQRALQSYEENGNWEALFQLVEIAPTSPIMGDMELRRLRHLARTYELRRVQRNRHLLYGYLLVQVLLVLVLFPFLFINAENGELQRQVEELANVAIGDRGYRLFTYTDGLYWSVITAASIGYGDITPMTTTGKLIAGILGTMGVVTIGVIAGLVLKWITPRTLD